MITQDTATEIWNCYREIAAGEQLLKDIDAERKEHRGPDKFEAKLQDAFGHFKRLQLGIPSGDNSHRLFGLSPHLAESIIRAHIAEKKAQLVALNERARIELDGENEKT